MSAAANGERGRGRTRAVVGLLACCALALAARLVQLQLVDQHGFARQARAQRFYEEPVPARPGEIVDRAGKLLATTVTTQSLYIVPSALDDLPQVAASLASVLDLDEHVLQKRLVAHAGKQFLWIKRRLSQEEADAVRELDFSEGTFGFRNEFQRWYPGGLAPQVIGLRDIDGVGQGGIEQQFDALLRGKDGVRVVARDARGKVIHVSTRHSRPARDGGRVQLTLDSTIQLHCEQALDALMDEWRPLSASAIVLDPQTGEILALASRPTFDPNAPAVEEPTAWKNHALSAIYEPGSTFKPFVVAWALEHGHIQRTDVFDCEHGEYRMGRRVLHDHHPYGDLDITGILVKSSNIGMAKIAERMGNAALFDCAVTFGFGRKTGVELPGELPGMLHPLRQWNSYSTGSVPMGQEIAVTPLQLITAHAALANGGRLIVPRIVRSYEDYAASSHDTAGATDSPPDEVPRSENSVPSEYPPTSSAAFPTRAPLIASPTVSDEVARWVVTKPLVDVVEHGTGKNGRLPGYTVFGKTGTSQKIEPTGGYSKTRHVGTFLCGAPAEAPRALVLVTVDEPRAGHSDYGGTVAAPAAAEILEKTLARLGVPPDRTDRQAESAPRRAGSSQRR